MNGRRAVSILTMLVLLAPAWSALAQRPARRPAARSAAGTPRAGAVASVGSVLLGRAELDARTQQALEQYRRNSGNRALPEEMMDLLRRQVLESMIRMQLVTWEADRTGLRGTEAEAEDELKQAPVFNPGGTFDAARFEQMRVARKAVFDSAVGTIRRQIGARKLYMQLGEKYQPTEAEARAAATRSLSRALLDHFALRLADFGGGYPEPRESQVVAEYAAHRDRWMRPDRATLTVAFVNTPGLPDSLREQPARVEAWSRRMRALADSLAGAMARGTAFDAAVKDLGPTASIVVAADNFPGYWRGTAAQAAKVFDARNVGRPILEPIPATEGWLLVRVDGVEPAHVAPLREVAREIRAGLRADSRLHHEEHEERELYAQFRDSLAGPGCALRYAAIDTSSLRLPAPTDEDLEHYYRGHQADYSSFDSRTGAIVVKPFAEVRSELALRLQADRRATEGRALADQIEGAWSAGRRDPASEARVPVRETPPLVVGSAIDTGAVATALTDTLWNLGIPQGAGTVPWARGWIVWTALGRAPRVVPTFEQARPMLALKVKARRAMAEIDGARAYFATDSMRFNSGNVLNFTRFSVPPPDLITVPLSRAEVEKWYHDHIDKYSAPELVTARHILIRPRDGSAAADSAAKARALDLLHRAKVGEDFAALARANSDDPATRDAGGDLGAFGRGTMLDAFEKAACALSPGEICDHPVHTEVGWHVIECVDHVPAFVQPLPIIYSTVSSDAAKEKADQIAHRRADSLVAACRTVAALRAAAVKLGFPIAPYRLPAGQEQVNPVLKPFFAELFAMQPGQGHTTPLYVKGEGYWIAWVDSVTAPVAPTWEEARPRVLAEYARGAGRRAMEAKRAELDSLAAAGWAYDSLAALWGGPEKALDVTPGHGIPGLGTSARFDSLVFGTANGAPLPVGKPSDWLPLASGLVRIRVVDRIPPPADQVTTRAQAIRAAELERRLRTYFAGLETRWPVKILDPRLRDVSLAEPPQGLTP